MLSNFSFELLQVALIDLTIFACYAISTIVVFRFSLPSEQLAYDVLEEHHFIVHFYSLLGDFYPCIVILEKLTNLIKSRSN